ncbi:SDR family oxidoreductase [Thalassolituus marinus]|uniref:SDR family oxidoreductase n=1 Tax=Thalassolituus marinus TaxID=671053 RepID=A0ABS7ZKB7_9GAMM|nr:SDR family oxidoreductase [Thalassolituus marinus]MCA6062143.1 SDR family oxidoreductase [Thalassolituus marinus]
MSQQQSKVALIIGAGDGNGAAIARRFARGGYEVCAVRRNGEKLQSLVDDVRAEGGRIHAFGCDARKEEQVVELIENIETNIGAIDVMVFNIGANVPCSFLSETSRKFIKIWEMACFSAFLTAREAALRMDTRGRGSIIFTGATASTRGASGFASFASAKSALRTMAQSMARELGPKNIHVAHVVIDGPVDTDFIREFMPKQYAERMPLDGILKPDHIAENYWNLHHQPRDAWTFELDLRPYMENW